MGEALQRLKNRCEKPMNTWLMFHTVTYMHEYILRRVCVHLCLAYHSFWANLEPLAFNGPYVERALAFLGPSSAHVAIDVTICARASHFLGTAT